MIDIVIPLGVGSHWQDNELRYALRSVEKHLSNYGNVYIIGERPDWITNVRHIYHPDESPFSDLNQKCKLQRACEEAEISETFLYMNDDHFLMQDFDASTFPNFYKETLEESIKRRGYDGYGVRMENTLKALQSKGKTTYNFDTHTPILFNKQKFIETVCAETWNRKTQFVVKSLYANQVEIDYIYEKDYKVLYPKDIGEAKIFSVYPVLTIEMREFLKNTFHVKSKYEL